MSAPLRGYIMTGSGALASQAFFPGFIDLVNTPSQRITAPDFAFAQTWGPFYGLALAELYEVGNPNINGGLSGPGIALSYPANQTNPPVEAPPAFWLGVRLGPSHRAILMQGHASVG